MGDLRNAVVRDRIKTWIGTTPWDRLVVLSLDPGEKNLIGAFGSTLTTAVGFEGRAVTTLYYGSGTLLAARNESVRQGHRFCNRISKELKEEVSTAASTNAVLDETIEALHSLHPENEWWRLRNQVERSAELSHAAHDILQAVLGGRYKQRTREQLSEMKLLVFVGDGGGANSVPETVVLRQAGSAFKALSWLWFADALWRCMKEEEKL
ncbi:hypothetical protein JCM3774_006022 [Rhodotorula dairenensis]